MEDLSEISEDGQEEDDLEEDDDVQTVIDDDDFEADMENVPTSESILQTYSTLPHAPVAAYPTSFQTLKSQNTEREKHTHDNQETEKIVKDDV